MSTISSSSSSLYVIYALYHQDDYKIRYIGLTTLGAESRLKRHIYQSKYNEKVGIQRKISNWVNKYSDRILIRVLEECPENNTDYLCYAERYWISFYRNLGVDLLNATDGGEGTFGWVPSDETRLLWKNQRTGRPLTDEWKKNIGDSQRGMSKEFLRNRPAWNSGKTFPELSGENSPRFGTTHSTESKKKMSKNHANVSGKNNPMYGSYPENLHVRWHESRGHVLEHCPHCVYGVLTGKYPKFSDLKVLQSLGFYTRLKL